MFARGAFILITLFWAAMNVLLWRAEYGERDSEGSFIPVEVVWGKILNAPDASSLSISQHGEKIGFCQWATSVGEEFAKYDEAPPEGMPNKTGKYQIEFGGDVRVPDVIRHLRFDCSLELSTNQSWREFSVRLGVHPASWEIRSVAAEQTVWIKTNDGEEHFERVFRFSDLQNPDALLREFASPFAYGLLGGLSLPVAAQAPRSLAAGIKWEARRGTLKIGHESVPIYRLQTRVLDRYPIVIFASHAGEILRAELPDGIILVYDPLTGL
jgi:hypothetical protein